MPKVKDSWVNNDQYTPAAANAVAAILNSLIGAVVPFAGPVAPPDWLFCYGQAVSRTAYADLFAVLNPALGTATVTIASPGVFTYNGHGFTTGDTVYLTTTGALPTGLAANTLYYVRADTANTFTLATSRANAFANTRINTSGTQSGTHTVWRSPHGNGDGTSTFNVPDLRGRVAAGNDWMGGTSANRLSLAQSQGTYGMHGATGGAQGHQLITAELAAHTHSYFGLSNAYSGGGLPATSNGGANTTGSAGGDTAHNNVQPTIVLNYIIKA